MVEGVAELGWLEMVARLCLAALLGAALGLEREYDGQDAGFRTHLLVVVGSALFAVVSVGAFDQFLAPQSDTNVVVDVTRIAAYVAPGIGFIGGGAILKYGGKVSGITTAASLWTAAAIGVATGLGAWQSAVAVTLLALLALEALQPLGTLVGRIGRRRRSHMVVALAEGASASTVVGEIERLATAPVKRLSMGVGPDDDGEIAVDFWHRPGPGAMERLVGEIRGLDGVRDVIVPGS